MARRRIFRPKEQVKILKYVDTGLCIKEVAQLFSTRQDIILSIIRDRDKLKDLARDASRKPSDDNERVTRAVLKWIKDTVDKNSPISARLIKQKTEEFEYDLVHNAFKTRLNRLKKRQLTKKNPVQFSQALQGDSSRPRRSNDDEDLDVDVDDTLAYGNPQYTELDVIPNRTDDTDKERTEQLRKAVLLNPSAERNVLESRKWNNNDDGPSSSDGSSFSLLDKIKKDDNESQDGLEEKLEKAEDQENCENKDEDDTVSSLKEKIKNLEDQTNNVKCLICLEPYTKPVVSTTCWHVHCEECWLMTMGVKKLCPQCNIIVFPSDLRRIYL